MVTHSAHSKNGHVDIHQGNAFAVEMEMAFGQSIFQEKLCQIFIVHALGQTGDIGIPAHHIKRDFILTHQVTAGGA